MNILPQELKAALIYLRKEFGIELASIHVSEMIHFLTEVFNKISTCSIAI